MSAAIRNINYSPRPPARNRNKEECQAYSSYKNVLRGTKLPQAKLSEEDVKLIRSLHAEGQRIYQHYLQTMTSSALALKFEVSKYTIHKIITRETWSHVE